ncbi:MAG: thymidine phosphorylase [Planctomycetes bacterium]|nr:thymidine phosphorylase [Planctomycetota bacterium]
MIQDWLEARREGREQSEKEIQAFVTAVVEDSITRAQAASWLAFVYCKGMTSAETVAFTRAMTESGVTMAWPGLQGPFIDKHSTGGVGDKVSLVLAPLWAELGYKVPMLSGRGLGITGGTLDKLEAIPGFKTDLPLGQLRGVLEDVGCFMNGQTAEIAPADRILYSLRDETGTVPSVPLITASILSKKLVEGLDKLVLDVKCGSGAFMQSAQRAAELAESLHRVGTGAGLEIETHITDMSQPLGLKIGNALEVEEAVECLQGGGPTDLIDIVVQLSGCGERARETLANGAAYPRWRKLLRAHGGDPDAKLHGGGCKTVVIEAPNSGVVTRCDAGDVGRCAHKLGAGRENSGEPVHFGVGVILHAKREDQVQAGQPLATLHHVDQKLDIAIGYIRNSFAVE